LLTCAFPFVKLVAPNGQRSAPAARYRLLAIRCRNSGVRAGSLPAYSGGTV